MKPARRQVSIGTLMGLIAAVACVLAVPRVAWSSVEPPKLDPVALLLLGLVGIALGVAGGKAASRAGGDLRADRRQGTRDEGPAVPVAPSHRLAGAVRLPGPDRPSRH